MKLPKFMMLVVFVTGMSLLYVYQQTEIYRLAYDGQKRNTELQDLANSNAALRYEIERGSSLIRIGDKLSQTVGFQMPDGYQMVKVRTGAPHPAVMRPARGENMLVRIFGVSRQAEAKTISTPTTRRTVGE